MLLPFKDQLQPCVKELNLLIISMSSVCQRCRAADAEDSYKETQPRQAEKVDPGSTT